MKKITVTNFDYAQQHRSANKMKDEMQVFGPEEMDASDGSHTFAELYAHRYALWIALAKAQKIIDGEFSASEEGRNQVWRSKNHSDGKPAFDGTWFLLGIGKNIGEQMTYHLPMTRWRDTEFAETLEKAPEYDGHTPDDVIHRLKSFKNT